jgi:hypothetical protein
MLSVAAASASALDASGIFCWVHWNLLSNASSSHRHTAVRRLHMKLSDDRISRYDVETVVKLGFGFSHLAHRSTLVIVKSKYLVINTLNENAQKNALDNFSSIIMMRGF